MAGPPDNPTPAMYERLLAYCQSFERHPQYRADMEFRSRTPLDYDSKTFISPFETGKHPVEMNLYLAALSTSQFSSTTFKERRRDILRWLEPQYRRLRSAHQKLSNFLPQNCSELERTGTSLASIPPGPETMTEDPEEIPWAALASSPFHRIWKEGHVPSPDDLQPVHQEASILLRIFHSAFSRDHPDAVWVEIFAQEDAWDAIYTAMPRSHALRSMNHSFQTHDACQWARGFWSAYKDMIAQWESIEKRRKDLFKGEEINEANRCKIQGFRLQDIEFNEDVAMMIRGMEDEVERVQKWEMRGESGELDRFLDEKREMFIKRVGFERTEDEAKSHDGEELDQEVDLAEGEDFVDEQLESVND